MHNDDMWTFLGGGTECLHGAFQLVEEDVGACMQSGAEDDGVKMGQTGDGDQGGCEVWPTQHRWGRGARGRGSCTKRVRRASRHAIECRQLRRR